MTRKLFLLVFIFFITCFSVFAQDVYAPYQPSKSEVIFNQSMFKIDVVDPVASTNIKGLNYPGLRGANQLVVYTPSFGMRTNTNEFGTEAIVVDDTVISLSGADSIIPANGFVISGHGSAKKWINENLMVGSKISLDLENYIITSYITSESFLYSAKAKIKEVQDMMAYYSQTCANYSSKKTELNINKAKDYIFKAQRNSEDSQRYASKAIEYANLAMSTVIPFSSKEVKGVWIRPTYFSKSDIEDVLDNLEKAGVDNVFIETYYHGKTIYPSEVMERYGFIKQYEDYQGFDPLKIWVEEAHKRNIKVHIWFQSFYVGNKPPETNPEYILALRPDWANYQKRNVGSSTIPYSVSEHNGYFIDPANPEVQAFLCELIEEIIEKYSPDGINLDYIRYPQALASTFPNYDMSNWGYTSFARKEFAETYGVDPIDIRPSDALWRHWKFYRCTKITNFVKKVSNITRANNVHLTAVIFPNRNLAIDTKLQDWKTWSINNFVDGFTPLLLTCDDKTATNLIEDVLRNKSASTKLYAGLFVTFMNGTNTDLIKQIHVTRRYSLDGIVMFDYAHMSDYYIETLNESVFKPSRRYITQEQNIVAQEVQQQEVKVKKKKKRKGRK